jgi:hypothetical protein
MSWVRFFFGFILVMGTGIVIACGGGNDSTATPSTAPSPAPSTVSPPTTGSSDGEVGAAYLHYWDVYSGAVYNLDDTQLASVMTGSQLLRTQQEVADLRQRGRAAKIVVEHNFFVAALDDAAGTATVYDQYTNSSYEVDATTHETVAAAASATMLSDTYYLVKEGGAWKVRDGVRQGQ